MNIQDILRTRELPPLTRNFPKTLYISLWFPLSSETFIFYEVDALHKRGLPVSVISLYDKKIKNLAPHIRQSTIPVERFGARRVGHILAAFGRRLWREPRKSLSIMRTLLCRRWRDAEMYLENLWAALSGFYLAERCKDMNIEHVHAAWANGPATAAWVVHKLDGLPFSFTARAGDVRPPDGFLAEKLRDCVFARADSYFNIPHLASFLPQSASAHVPPHTHDKLYLVYNVATLPSRGTAPVHMRAPYTLLAIGRLIETKGFQYLIDAVRLLVDSGVNVRLIIAGSGAWMGKLQARVKQQRVEQYVELAGFVTHDKVAQYLMESDVFVMPSIVKAKRGSSDGLPTVVVEAMCHHVPVVGTDVASMSDVVRDGDTGYLVPPRDAAALAEAIRALTADRENAVHMAARANTLVKDMFDSENNMNRMCWLFCAYSNIPDTKDKA